MSRGFLQKNEVEWQLSSFSFQITALPGKLATMTHVLSSLNTCLKHDFDTIIDVRSPAEYALDHFPGAINLPVLSDQERAEVGTIYKQQSPFAARKLGAALVFRNAANHIEASLSHHKGGWKPLVYCWRGGQRSGAFTWVLREIGWQAEVVQGGYQSYRRLVSQYLYDTPFRCNLFQLGGYTGTAKTVLLTKLQALGVQVVDLEALAGHRGSLLGGMPGGQPSQKGFESQLAAIWSALDPLKPILVEAESSKIGDINLPPSLWKAMQKAPWIEIRASLEARARYLSEAYEDVLADTISLKERLQPLRVFRGHAVVEHWHELIDQGEKVALCQSLARDHYDPAYDKSMRVTDPKILRRFDIHNLSDPTLDDIAKEIAVYLQAISM